MPGLEGFSAGALHPLTAPAQLLIIVAFGLLTGQRPPPLDLKPLFIFFAPILAFALTLTATGVIRGVYQPVLIGIALCAAIPVALEKPVSPLIYRVLTTRWPWLSDSIRRLNQALPAF
jgi:hydrogenase/urease accessory protein HupE